MPRKYHIDDLKRAVSAVTDGGLSIREAQRMYNVPFNTIRRRVQGSVEEDCIRPGPKPALGIECEVELKEAIIEMQKMGHGLSCKEVCQLAADIAENRSENIFKNGIPTKKWFKGFMLRHNLSLRKAENLSAARSEMANMTVKNEFFEKLKEQIDTLGVSGSEIYNADETGLTLVNKGSKIVATKGAKSVVARKSGERSENITVMGACNATGSVILPPMVIFKGVRLNDDLMKGAPEGTIFAMSPKGYIDTDLFFDWFVRFTQLIPPKRPVLLLMDGHASHINPQTIHVAKQNNISILLFPPHTTQLYQPLDVGVYGPLKKAFSEECVKRMRKNKKKILSRYDFCAIFKPAWLKAVSPSNIVGGFAGSGVSPFNPDAVNNKLQTGDIHAAGPSQPNTTSPIIAVIRELLTPTPVNNETRKSRKVTKTRCITSEEFEKELLPKDKRNEHPHSSDDEDSQQMDVGEDATTNDENHCATCNGDYVNDRHGESWIRCNYCKLWYHQTCQNLRNSAKPRYFKCLSCETD